MSIAIRVKIKAESFDSVFEWMYKIIFKHLGHSIKFSLAGEDGFEPSDAASKGRCLTTWLLPNITHKLFPYQNIL
jgi:hypothetical protein